MKVIVTGASGFVGRQVVKRLRADGHVVRGLGRTPNANEANWITCDLSVSTPKAQELEAELVVHCAGQAHASAATAEDYQRNIPRATGSLLLALKDRAECRQFVFLSSIKAFGESGYRNAVESTKPSPITDYGRCKLEAEKLVRDAAEYLGVTVVLRPSPVYGPEGKGIIGLLARAGHYGLIPNLKPTTGIRSYVHVEDLADSISSCLSLKDGDHVFHVSDGREYTYQNMREALNQKRVPMPSIGHTTIRLLTRKPFDERLRLHDRLLADCHVSSNLLTQETGWEPQRQLGSLT